MTDLRAILHIEPGAAPEQIRGAYNKKRAELISLEGTDPTAAEQIRELDEAFAQLNETTALAIAPTVSARPPLNPILEMVNSLDAPIQEGGENITYQPCPYCGNQNPSQSTVCLACGNQISRPCPNCGKQLFLVQSVCPRCSTVIRDHDQLRLADAMLTKQRVEDERLENGVRVEAQESAHRKRAGFGCLFWTAILFATLVVCSVSLYALYYFGNQR
jgi:hypothetical protein